MSCSALTLKGKNCGNKKYKGSEFCKIHNPEYKCNCCSKLACKNGFCKNHLKLETCGICLEEMKYKYQCVLKNCAHEFCKRCIHQWLFHNSTCPMCRTKVSDSERAISRDYCIIFGIVLGVTKKFAYCEYKSLESRALFRTIIFNKYNYPELTQEDFSDFLYFVTKLYNRNPGKYQELIRMVASIKYYTTYIYMNEGISKNTISLKYI